MTTVTFHSEGSRLTGFEMKGHSGYAPQGEDIVCAALSSAVRLIEGWQEPVSQLKAVSDGEKLELLAM